MLRGVTDKFNKFYQSRTGLQEELCLGFGLSGSSRWNINNLSLSLKVPSGRGCPNDPPVLSLCDSPCAEPSADLILQEVSHHKWTMLPIVSSVLNINGISLPRASSVTKKYLT